MKMRMAIIGAMIALGAWTADAASVLPYGTYLVKGTFVGDYNTVLREDASAKVQAMRKDGTVIAEAKVFAANAEGVNFILQIPVSSLATSAACVVGEVLDCALKLAEEDPLTVPDCLKVKSPTEVGIFSICCTPVKTFVNPKDGTTVEIPVAYIAEAQSYLPAGETYDPWKDYDSDGVSNYAEFLAGTIPFDDKDYLRVLAFGQKDGKLALKFEHVGGHVYAVSSANMLEKPAWAKRRVRKSADGDELDQVLAEGGDGEPGATEIYITPVADAASEFFKVEGK